MQGNELTEEILIKVLCQRSVNQRIALSDAYKKEYNDDLLENIKSVTSGHFQSVVMSLFLRNSELYARDLYETRKSENSKVLIEVMCTMSNFEICNVGAALLRMYELTLDQYFEKYTTGDFKRLMVELFAHNRDETVMTNRDDARFDAEALKSLSLDESLTDECILIKILCLRSYGQISLIAREYGQLTESTLESDITRNFSGHMKAGLLAILGAAHYRPLFLASSLYKSVKGFRTDHRTLIRLIVTRSEVDMVDVKDAFVSKYGKHLRSHIEARTSFNYRLTLLTLIKYK